MTSVEPSIRGDSIPPLAALPIGVLLAGGLGRRLGGDKALADLAGRPLISYALAALRGVLDDVVVVAKPDTALPPLADTPTWLEPAAPRHPLVGIAHALQRAAGRDIVVCAVDLPCVSPALVRRIAAVAPGEPRVRVAGDGHGLQPLLGRYPAGALAPLSAALARTPLPPLREVVTALDPVLVAVDGPHELLNVNSEADLRRAADVLGRGETI